MRRARGVGVNGYLLKGDADGDLIEAIFTLSEGKTYFASIQSKYEHSESLGRTLLI
jgi:DNA-binding NarL/FixJ family response regulator